MTYTDQATIEAFLKRSLSADEQTILPLILEVTDSYIESEIGIFGDVAESSRFYTGGLRIIDIDSCFSISAVSLVDENNTVTYTYLSNEVLYLPINESGKRYLESRYGAFPCGKSNLKVTGKFTNALTVPNDVKYLATYLSGQLFSSNIVSNLQSESIEGYSRTFNKMLEENQMLKLIMDKYTKNDVMIC